MRQFLEPVQLFNAKAATGHSVALHVADYHELALMISAAVNSDLTLKVKGSYAKEQPDFTSAQTVANHWDWVEMFDVNDSTLRLTGDTGLVYTADTVANNTRNFSINQAHPLRWICLQVSALSAGTVTATISGCTKS